MKYSTSLLPGGRSSSSPSIAPANREDRGSTALAVGVDGRESGFVFIIFHSCAFPEF